MRGAETSATSISYTIQVSNVDASIKKLVVLPTPYIGEAFAKAFAAHKARSVLENEIELVSQLEVQLMDVADVSAPRITFLDKRPRIIEGDDQDDDYYDDEDDYEEEDSEEDEDEDDDKDYDSKRDEDEDDEDEYIDEGKQNREKRKDGQKDQREDDSPNNEDDSKSSDSSKSEDEESQGSKFSKASNASIHLGPHRETAAERAQRQERQQAAQEYRRAEERLMKRLRHQWERQNKRAERRKKRAAEREERRQVRLFQRQQEFKQRQMLEFERKQAHFRGVHPSKHVSCFVSSNWRGDDIVDENEKQINPILKEIDQSKNSGDLRLAKINDYKQKRKEYYLAIQQDEFKIAPSSRTSHYIYTYEDKTSSSLSMSNQISFERDRKAAGASESNLEEDQDFLLSPSIEHEIQFRQPAAFLLTPTTQTELMYALFAACPSLDLLYASLLTALRRKRR
ncbi:MAG: hypothetical protein EZS28_032038 [Streblomastix strix]|uniref:Uncharacterized protein n=1 Tax=Streblomastix strix TaxID=222440 RepID=A0A5J4UQJ8_9EUKA|nr:MAG: hypothetical protein EZS28_032038 [Streblomastix strix]